MIWKSLPYKSHLLHQNFCGGLNQVNHPLEAGDSQLIQCENISFGLNPAISVREGRTLFLSETTPEADITSLGTRGKKLHRICGGIWQEVNPDGSVRVITDGICALPGRFEEFSTGTHVYTIFTNGMDRFVWDGTAITSLSAVEETSTDLLASYRGRLYWAKGKNITFSALFKTDDYESPYDAGMLTVSEASGDITAICSFNGRLAVFEENAMHELYGTGPDTYSLIKIEGDTGCSGQNVLCISGRRLYWLSWDGVYEYNGAVPVKISEATSSNGVSGGINRILERIDFSKIKEMRACSCGDIIYFSLKLKNDIETLITFNAAQRKWSQESGYFPHMTRVEGVLHAANKSGVWQFGSPGYHDDGSRIPFSFTTKPFCDASPSMNKSLAEFIVTYELPADSEMSMYAVPSAESENFIKICDFPNTSGGVVRHIKIPAGFLHNVPWYRLRFIGKGTFILHFLEKKLRVRV